MRVPNLHKVLPLVSHVEHASTTVIGATFIAEHCTSFLILAGFVVVLLIFAVFKEG